MTVRLSSRRTSTIAKATFETRESGRLATRNSFRSVAIATSRTARDINRLIILNLIRKHQPISRADLARISRLQRSTVSVITEQLIAERLVTVGVQGNLPRGRRPTFLHLNQSRIVAVGVEINPEETTIAVADLTFHMVTRETIPTRQDVEQFVTELSQRIVAIKTALPHLTFTGIGITLPGRLDPVLQRLAFAPTLPWQSMDLKSPLEQSTGLPVVIENVANACVLAELWQGRYPDTVQNMIAIMVNDGIEVGLVLNGQIVRGVGGLAGEFGHVIVQEKGPECCCGNRGCLSVCGSNLAAIRHYQGRTSAKNHSNTVAPNFAEILHRADLGERLAIQALQSMAHNLGLGVAMLVTGLSPDVIVLVGELANGWRLIGPIIDQVVAQRIPTKFRSRVLPIAPESQLPLRGALVLVLQQPFGMPKAL